VAKQEVAEAVTARPNFAKPESAKITPPQNEVFTVE
jgi:hypothetical protein